MAERRVTVFAPLMLVALLTLSLLPVSSARSAVAVKAPPMLRELAAQQPHSSVRVIIQRMDGAQDVERLVAAAGGSVINDLRIINALVAIVPAHRIDQLARHDEVRWISLDAPAIDPSGTKPGDGSGGTTTPCTGSQCIDASKLKSPYITVIGADKAWNTAPYLQGQGVTVAVIDSGIAEREDFQNSTGATRIIAKNKFNSSVSEMGDSYGHGSHVAGIIGGNGTMSGGSYIGVAPKVNLINVKVSDNVGSAYASDVVAGMQWLYENRNTYNIRVVNISLNSSVAESYHTDPLCAAAEILWMSGIVVVAAAGNNGSGGVLPPANDPFVITVGAMNDQKTLDIADDRLASFSAYGTTSDGFRKPDLVAPGVDIKSVLASQSSYLAVTYPDHIAPDETKYFRMSGTSMAAPMVSGAVALLLQDEPSLTPDQVKYRLTSTAKRLRLEGTGAGYLNIPAAIAGTTTASSNTGTNASQLLWSGSEPVTWNSVSWNSVSWNSVSWNSVSWNSVSWNSVSWNSTYWGSAR